MTSLASWYRANGRHTLPWRATRDRWCVLVSEVMLHQTQVPRVIPAYDAAEQTSLLAAHLGFEMISLVALRRLEKGRDA